MDEWILDAVQVRIKLLSVKKNVCNSQNSLCFKVCVFG